MAMSKKHYESIAEAFNGVMFTAARQESGSCATLLTILAADLAARFKADNALFDKDRFMRACVKSAAEHVTSQKPSYRRVPAATLAVWKSAGSDVPVHTIES